MAKIHFFYGTVSSAKTAELLIKAHYLESIGKRILYFKPYDSRDGFNITSRTGLTHSAIDINDFERAVSNNNIEVVFIDEVQFVDPEQLKNVIDVCNRENISIFAYGLKSDIKSNLFPAIIILMSHATHLTEIKAFCAKCGKSKAIYNVRLDKNGKVDNTGPVLSPGFNYEGRCWKCSKD